MAFPGWGDLCNLATAGICGAVKSGAKAVAGSAFQAVVDAFTSGLADVMKALMSFWINVPSPDVSQGSAVIDTLDSLTKPLVAFGAIIGLIVGGTRLAWSARQEQTGRNLLRGLLLMVVVTGAGATIVAVALTGVDDLAKWILDHGFDGHSVADRLQALGSLPGLGGGLVFLLAFLGMLASLVQVGIMLVRGAILAVLVGILPVAAASAITDTGYTWFRRLCGWIGSFVLYKLVAAIIYAAAFTMIGDATDLPGIVGGFSLLIVAILALPALLRLIPPSAEAMGGSGGGGSAALGAAATGAVMLSGRGSGGGAPAATATPGLKGNESAGPSGASPTFGGGTSQTSPTNGAGASGTGAAAATAGAAGGGLAVLQTIHSAGKSAANGAVGTGGDQ